MSRVYVVTALLLFGCASAPKNYNFEASETYEASYDEVWSAVIDVFSENDWPIQTLEKDSGLISTTHAGMTRNSNWSDCDVGMFETLEDKVGSFNVRVREVQGGTSLTVNASFSGVVDTLGGIQRKNCVSTGQLEMQIRHLVRRNLRQG